MRRILILVLTIILVLGFVGPATAAEDPVGDQLNVLFGTPAAFPADTPFHVIHGWGPLVPNEINALGVIGFRLELDGVDLGSGALLNTVVGSQEKTRQWLYNFDDGLPAGTYLFTGHWILPCANAVDIGLFPGPCATPNVPIEAYTAQLLVTFS